MWKVTFTFKGYIAGVFYNSAMSAEAAIEAANLYCIATWNTVRAEWVPDDDV